MIPGFIVTWLTFPGVIVHELGHQLLCLFTDTPVRAVCYFRFGNPAGYVIHDRPSNVWKQILIGFGPLLVNSTLGFLLGLTAVATQDVWLRGNTPFIGGALSWLAVSVAMHSFPSTGDAQTIWQSIWDKQSPFLAWLVGLPLVGVIYLGAVGSIIWLDLAYGALLAWIWPQYLLG